MIVPIKSEKVKKMSVNSLSEKVKLYYRGKKEESGLTRGEYVQAVAKLSLASNPKHKEWLEKRLQLAKEKAGIKS